MRITLIFSWSRTPSAQSGVRYSSYDDSSCKACVDSHHMGWATQHCTLHSSVHPEDASTVEVLLINGQEDGTLKTTIANGPLSRHRSADCAGNLHLDGPGQLLRPRWVSTITEGAGGCPGHGRLARV